MQMSTFWNDVFEFCLVHVSGFRGWEWFVLFGRLGHSCWRAL